ncbi:MAG: hypothetical protein H7Y04_15275, partial [Verrucomicrobia bacterium]|nr:hypothetical protein [Cytophagales bacterium]
MLLNYIWLGLFAIAFVVALIRLIFFQDVEIFPLMVKTMFDRADKAFALSLSLTGVLALWLGIMKIGERAGIVEMLAKAVAPLFSKIFPEIPKDHPVIGKILLNFSANILGLDNAGTPIGIKAMQDMQMLNPEMETASNSQIMFIVLNASGMTILPISIFAFRAKYGAINPTDVFIPLLIAKSFSLLAGFAFVAVKQKIAIWQWSMLKYIIGYFGVLA